LAVWCKGYTFIHQIILNQAKTTLLMRKYNWLSLLLIASTFVIVSCTKEGPEGPPGVPGPQGNAGPQGPTGPGGTNGTNAQVTYSAWHAPIGAWRDTVLIGNFKVNHAIANAITANIINQGVILAYTRFNGGIPSPLPDTEHTGAAAVTLSFLPDVGKIFYTCFTHDNTASAVPANREFRWVVIPGITLGGRTKDPRTMTYQEVCQAYGIPE
jgi:hypothetical protein